MIWLTDLQRRRLVGIAEAEGLGDIVAALECPMEDDYVVIHRDQWARVDEWALLRGRS